jgi:archaellum biogenesis protein FlaJ (TadC family)
MQAVFYNFITKEIEEGGNYGVSLDYELLMNWISDLKMNIIWHIMKLQLEM